MATARRLSRPWTGMIADAKAGKKFRASIGLTQPTEQTKDYDQAIKMLEMSVDDTISLDSASFSQLVMNRWHWSGNFSASNKAYVSGETVGYLEALEQG